MKEYEVVQQALWDAARKLIKPHHKGYTPLEDTFTKNIHAIVKKTLEFLDQHIELKKSIYASAALVEKASLHENGFEYKTNAIQSLDIKTKEAVTMSQAQNDIKRAVQNKLWDKSLLLAAGRLMRSASLAIDASPEDVGIVDEAKRRGPLLVKCTNRICLGIEGNSKNIDPITHAMSLIPARQPYIVHIPKHPDEPDDDAMTQLFKTRVENELWTEEVLLAAGRINADRSLNLTPSWEDIEKTHQADHLGRLVVVHLLENKSKYISSEGEILFPENRVADAIEAVKATLKQPLPIDEKILYVVQEKIHQYVWTSHPDICQARAHYEKHGSYFTLHGEVLLVQKAWEAQIMLVSAVCELLMEMEQERLDEAPNPLISWFWKTTPQNNQVKNELVSHQLEEELNKNNSYLRKWLGNNKHTLKLAPEDITNELIDKAAEKVALEKINEPIKHAVNASF